MPIIACNVEDRPCRKLTLYDPVVLFVCWLLLGVNIALRLIG